MAECFVIREEEVLESSVCEEGEIDGEAEQEVGWGSVGVAVFIGSGGVCVPGVHIQSLRGCCEYVVGDVVSGLV